MRALMANSTDKSRFVCWVFGLSAAVTSVLVSGCAANREDLAKSGHVALKKHSSEKIYIAWCDAYRDENGLLVTGVLRRRDCVGLGIKVHVDVRVISPEGNVIQEGCSEDIYVPRRMTGRGQSLKRFQVRFSEVPPKGSTVRLTVELG